MGSIRSRRVEDFPHFLVSGIRQGEAHATGCADFELSGEFDRTDGVSEGRCWLLLPERDCLIGDLKLLDPATKTALFFTSEESIPELIGSKLPYLESRWEPYHVWMVVEPKWIWNKVLFRAKDARAKQFQAQDVTILDGQEVKEWMEIEKAEGHSSGSRFYPIFPGGRTNLADAGPDGLINDGWDHEHCEICNNHIDPGNYAYLDLGEHWVCEKCYTEYVSAHDLSFLAIM